MECLIGIQCKDFVLIAADMTTAQSIIVMKSGYEQTFYRAAFENVTHVHRASFYLPYLLKDEHKIHKISDKLVMAISGESGDTTQFSEYIGKNIQLYKMRNGYELSPKAAACFTRRNLADYLRSRTPYFVNMLLAGYDDDTGPELYFIDYLASCVKVPYATHGYGGMFSMSVLDRYYKYDSTEEEAYILLKKCVREIQKRLIVNLPNFKVQKIFKDGIKDMQPITAENLAVESVAKA